MSGRSGGPIPQGLTDAQRAEWERWCATAKRRDNLRDEVEWWLRAENAKLRKKLSDALDDAQDWDALS